MKIEGHNQSFRPGVMKSVFVTGICDWCDAAATHTEIFTWMDDYLRTGDKSYYWCDECLPKRKAQGWEWPNPSPTKNGLSVENVMKLIKKLSQEEPPPTL